jgi:DNA-binding MarR family transcriptional regulator
MTYRYEEGRREEQEEMLERALRAQRAIMRALHAAADPAWLALDLTMAQLKALFVLAEDAGLTVGGLANLLGIGKPAASILVERLVQLQLVTRAEDVHDRRRTLVRLTPRGEDLASELRRGGDDRMRALLAQLAAGDLAALVQGLQALAEVTAAPSRQVATSA